MFPIALNLTRIPLLLAGQGALLAKRLSYLQEAGATQITVLNGDQGFDAALPQAAIVMIAGLENTHAKQLVDKAHAAGKLVNVEDINDLCDFYFTANVKRGDLVIAVSTSGASPTLARKIRDKIAAMFGPEWEARVRDMGEQRNAWKASGAGFSQLIEHAERYLAEKGWLNDKNEAA